jgi:hypothetical protein
MKKIVYKNPAQIETMIFFGLGLFFLILFIVIPGFYRGFSKELFWQKDSIASFLFPVSILILSYWFFLTKWERLVVEDGFLKLKYARFFLPGYKKLAIAEINEVVFIYKGQTDGQRKFSREIIKDLKNKVGEKIDSLLFQKGFCESANYSNGKTSLSVSVARIFFKTNKTQAPIKFFSKKTMLEILNLLPKEIKKSWRFGRIEYSDISDVINYLPN